MIQALPIPHTAHRTNLLSDLAPALFITAIVLIGLFAYFALTAGLGATLTSTRCLLELAAIPTVPLLAGSTIGHFLVR